MAEPGAGAAAARADGSASPAGASTGGPAPLRWADNHCHLPYDDPPALMELLEDARSAGVARFVTVGTDLVSSRAHMALSRRFDDVEATAGVHPHDAKDGIEGLEALLVEGVAVAVGECGLDHHYDHSPRDVQRQVFADQIALAHRHGLALVIHTREAWEDTFDVLAAEGVPERTVLHCFTGGPEEARRCLDLGAHISFSGIVTFPSAPEVREAAALCPLDRVLVETDSPYLAPVPHRGRRNRPANVALVGAAVAEAMGREVEDVAEATWANASAVYGLPVD